MTEESTLEIDDGTAHLRGALVFGSAGLLYREMERKRTEGANPNRIDLSGVTSVDSAGLALLLEWQAAAGGGLSMTGAPSSLEQLARLSEATELLRLGGRETG
jgi:phospholipid transport system transporter-binding protein